MKFGKWLFPLVCASSVAMAQTSNDLNGLVAAAGHYVASGMAGVHDPEPLALARVTGDSGVPDSGLLMTKGTDVQHWTFVYRLGFTAAGEGAPQVRRSVLADCTKGVFDHFRYSAKPVLGAKSLENTWAAVSLDSAILDLNASGYVRGFSSVAMVRPDNPHVSDDLVYVFNCPWERQNVAISCQTGALAWTQSY